MSDSSRLVVWKEAKHKFSKRTKDIIPSGEAWIHLDNGFECVVREVKAGSRAGLLCQLEGSGGKGKYQKRVFVEVKK